MNVFISKSYSALALLLAGVCGSQLVYAHDYVGALTNGSSPLLGTPNEGATDIGDVTCFQDEASPSQNPSDHLFLQIKSNTGGSNIISATAITGNKAVTVTDTVGGDAAGTPMVLKLPTPVQSASFKIMIYHTDAVAQDYLLTYHCEDALGVHTGTVELTLTQNQ